MSTYVEMMKGLHCLNLEAPGVVVDDIKARVLAHCSHLEERAEVAEAALLTREADNLLLARLLNESVQLVQEAAPEILRLQTALDELLLNK